MPNPPYPEKSSPEVLPAAALDEPREPVTGDAVGDDGAARVVAQHDGGHEGYEAAAVEGVALA